MIRYRLEYLLTQVLKVIGNNLSTKGYFILGDVLGDLFYFVIRSRKKVAFRNLKETFGDSKSDKEINQILRKHYRHFGRTLLEFARLPLLANKSLIEQIPLKNEEIFWETVGLNKGILILSGHFGNWEYMAAKMASISPPVYCVFKEQKNLAVDKLIKDYRMNMGLRPLKVKGGAARGVLLAMKERSKAVIVMDQDAGGKGVFVNFLGRPASTAKGPAQIAIKHNVPVIFAFGVRGKNGLIRIEFERFPDLQKYSNDENGVEQFLLDYNKILEKYIRKYPEQWFWLHRRWKTQPKI